MQQPEISIHPLIGRLLWNSKTLAVFVLKMTGAFALGGKKKSSIL